MGNALSPMKQPAEVLKHLHGPNPRQEVKLKSQANPVHITNSAPATYPLAGTVLFDEADRCYALQTATERLVVDPSQKGEPGDLVIVWRRKHGPMVARRLARCQPYRCFYFGDRTTGSTFELPCNKVSAIHAVVGGAS